VCLCARTAATAAASLSKTPNFGMFLSIYRFEEVGKNEYRSVNVQLCSRKGRSGTNTLIIILLYMRCFGVTLYI
jgi:hypothetical protein